MCSPEGNSKAATGAWCARQKSGRAASSSGLFPVGTSTALKGMDVPCLRFMLGSRLWWEKGRWAACQCRDGSRQGEADTQADTAGCDCQHNVARTQTCIQRLRARRCVWRGVTVRQRGCRQESTNPRLLHGSGLVDNMHRQTYTDTHAQTLVDKYTQQHSQGSVRFSIRMSQLYSSSRLCNSSTGQDHSAAHHKRCRQELMRLIKTPQAAGYAVSSTPTELHNPGEGNGNVRGSQLAWRPQT